MGKRKSEAKREWRRKRRTAGGDVSDDTDPTVVDSLPSLAITAGGNVSDDTGPTVVDSLPSSASTAGGNVSDDTGPIVVDSLPSSAACPTVEGTNSPHVLPSPGDTAGSDAPTSLPFHDRDARLYFERQRRFVDLEHSEDSDMAMHHRNCFELALQCFCVAHPEQGVADSIRRVIVNDAVVSDMEGAIPGAVGLTRMQARALFMASGCNFTVLQGPPGTGKTKTAVEIVKSWAGHLSLRGANKAILVCSHSNAAVDNFATSLSKTSLQVVRVGKKAGASVEHLGLPFGAAAAKRCLRAVDVVLTTNMGTSSPSDDISTNYLAFDWVTCTV
jgi:hypothetical protein